MAAGEMGDFLKEYYKILHTRHMPDAVLAQLVKDKKDGFLTGHQQEWFNKFLEEYTDSDGDTKYRAKALPELSNTDKLTKDELVKLYKRLTMAIAAMKSASTFYDAQNDANAIAFVKKWFDEIQLFPVPKATEECDNAIQKLVKKLDITNKTPTEIDTIKNIKQVIKDEAKETKKDGTRDQLFTNIEAIDKLIAKCKDGKYNEDTSVQNKIQEVARVLDDYLNSYSWPSYGEEKTANTKQKNKAYISDLSDDLATIAREDAFSEIDVDAKKLEDFRDIYAPEILDKLYLDQSVRKKFADKDPKFVEDFITKQENKVSWHDPNSDDYVEPKYEDSLNVIEQVKKWAGDTYDDTLKKYSELRGGHVFFSPYAKAICKAIDKENIKPSDGLDGLLKNAANVKNRLTNKTLAKHFDWFTETLGKLNGKIPYAIQGCWKDADKMKCVIEQIILAAVNSRDEENAKENMEKAKTAMEIMTVMKYGMLTSKVMDAMKQTEFNLFSDDKLLWNTDEGIKFVTKAFDKSVKAAFLGIGYGITFLRNKYKMSGMKFTNDDNTKGALANRFTSFKTQTEKSGPQAKERLQATIDNKKTELEQQIAEKENMGGETFKILNKELHYNDDNIEQIKAYKNAMEKQLKTLQDEKDNLSKEMLKQQQNMEKSLSLQYQHQETKENYDNFTKILNNGDLKEKIEDLTNKRNDLKKQVDAIMKTLSAPQLLDPNNKSITDPDNEKSYKDVLWQEVGNLRKQIQQYENEINEAEAEIKSPSQERKILLQKAKRNLNNSEFKNDLETYNQAVKSYKTAEKDYKTAQKKYSEIEDVYNKKSQSLHYDEVSDKINKFESATESIKELNTTIEERQTALENWDKDHINPILELENYWNFLQGNTKTWSISLKRAQENFDSLKPQLLQQHIGRYGLTG